MDIKNGTKVFRNTPFANAAESFFTPESPSALSSTSESSPVTFSTSESSSVPSPTSELSSKSSSTNESSPKSTAASSSCSSARSEDSFSSDEPVSTDDANSSPLECCVANPQFAASYSSAWAPLAVPMHDTMPPAFGRRYGRLTDRELTVLVGRQKRLPYQTYNVLRSLMSEQLPISQSEFVRVWRMLVYKRCEDLHIRQTGRLVKNSVYLPHKLPVPAPLGDLLHSLGTYESAQIGVRFRVLPPEISGTERPDWTRPSSRLLDAWFQMVDQIATVYTLKPYPSQQQWRSSGVPMTTKSPITNDRLVSVYSLTAEPVPSNAYLCTVFDKLFSPAPFDHRIGFRVVHNASRAKLLAEYCLSYVKRSTG